MDKQFRANVYLEEAVRVQSHLNDFSGMGSEWKYAVYQLFRYNMTWGFAHRIDVKEGRSRGVYVDMLINPAYEEQLKETMDGLGFKNTVCTKEKIGQIIGYDLPEDTMIDYVDIDY